MSVSFAHVGVMIIRFNFKVLTFAWPVRMCAWAARYFSSSSSDPERVLQTCRWAPVSRVLCFPAQQSISKSLYLLSPPSGASVFKNHREKTARGERVRVWILSPEPLSMENQTYLTNKAIGDIRVGFQKRKHAQTRNASKRKCKTRSQNNKSILTTYNKLNKHCA